MARILEPAIRKLLLSLAEAEIDNVTDKDGVIDKDAATDRILSLLSRPQNAINLPMLRSAALRFLVYEHVRYYVRNRKRPAGMKGADEGGTRAIISIPLGNNHYAAKEVNRLTEEDCETAIEDYDRRIKALRKQREELEDQRRYVAATEGSK